jgi:hypothetical protein
MQPTDENIFYESPEKKFNLWIIAGIIGILIIVFLILGAVFLNNFNQNPTSKTESTAEVEIVNEPAEEKIIEMPEDPAKEVIRDFYEALRTGDYEKAYALSDKSKSVSEYKNLYSTVKDISVVAIESPVKDFDYGVVVDLFEFGKWTRYYVGIDMSEDKTHFEKSKVTRQIERNGDDRFDEDLISELQRELKTSNRPENYDIYSIEGFDAIYVSRIRIRSNDIEKTRIWSSFTTEDIEKIYYIKLKDKEYSYYESNDVWIEKNLESDKNSYSYWSNGFGNLWGTNNNPSCYFIDLTDTFERLQTNPADNSNIPNKIINKITDSITLPNGPYYIVSSSSDCAYESKYNSTEHWGGGVTLSGSPDTYDSDFNLLLFGNGGFEFEGSYYIVRDNLDMSPIKPPVGKIMSMEEYMKIGNNKKD